MVPDILTDQTSAHDPLNGYVAHGMTLAEVARCGSATPRAIRSGRSIRIARHVEGMLQLQKMGSVTFDYGNNIRTFAFQHGVKNAYDFPGFVPEYIRPLFCEGRGPFRWVALSGDPSDIYVTDDLVLEMFPENRIFGAGSNWRASDQVSGVAGSHLLARLWRAGAVRPGDQRTGEERKDQGADGDGARSSRLRFSCVAISRNRKHEGRLGRHRRLAPAECHAEYRRRSSNTVAKAST